MIFLAAAFYSRPTILQVSEERDVDMARRSFIERPVALATLLWAILVPELLLPPLPLGLVVIRLLLVVAALWRMLPVIAPTLEQTSVAGLLGLTLLSGVLAVIQQSDMSDRLVLLFVSTASIYLFRKFAAALRQSEDYRQGLWWHIGYALSVAAPYVMLLSIGAVVIGAVAFAQQTTWTACCTCSR